MPYHLRGKNWNPFHRFLGLYSWSWIGQSENPFPFVKWVPWNKKKINVTLQISLHSFTVLNMNIAFLSYLELFSEIYLHCLVMMTVVQFSLELSNNSIFCKTKGMWLFNLPNLSNSLSFLITVSRIFHSLAIRNCSFLTILKI